MSLKCQNCGNIINGNRQYLCENPECEEYVKNIKENIKKKRELTNLKKYGCKNVSQSKKIKDKKETTFLKKYGVSNGFKSPEIQEKIKNTNLEKYGAPNPAQSKELLEKRFETNFKKYNSKSPFGAPEIQEKSKNTCLEKYGADNPLKLKEFQEKSKDTKIQKYNNPNYNNPEKIRNTNISKYGVPNHSQKDVKNFEDYADENIWKNFRSSKEAAEYFGIDIVTARSKLYVYNPDIVKCRSQIQKYIFESVKTDSKIQNSKIILNGREIDIYIPKAKLAIEYNGLMFHSQGISDVSMFNTPNFDKNYHLKKTQECAEKGIQLFHIFEGEPLDLWLSMIHNKLGLNTKVFARKCIIKEIKNSDTKEFQNSNHIQGFCAAKICLGLYYNFKNPKDATKVEDSELVGIMTFAKPRFNNEYEYELIRFCTLKNHNVIGGASKLWKYFLKKYNPKSVISYANLRFSNGSIYQTLGFIKISQSNPNYFYFKNSNILESRNKFQKHKLANLHYSGILQCFDPNKSEIQNMFENGYRRIFDCGNLVYGFVNK